MARNQSTKEKKLPLRDFQLSTTSSNISQDDGNSTHHHEDTSKVAELSNLKFLLIDEAHPCSSTSTNELHSNPTTAALHDELDSFRQRWKRELATKSQDSDSILAPTGNRFRKDSKESKENRAKGTDIEELNASISKPPDSPQEVYALAKKLFLIGVDFEQDEMYHESIRYYKQAMHLYPDIEREIFREQCGANLKSSTDSSSKSNSKLGIKDILVDSYHEVDEEKKIPLYDRIYSAIQEDPNINHFSYCRPSLELKTGTKHMCNLPRDILLQIVRCVIGSELDLASLETLGLVCRGFYLLSRDSSLWRSVCFHTWGNEIFNTQGHKNQIDWRQMYLEKPRVNCDGIYISRTRYIRQGDVGFQDITYRPFHVIRYYRYLRFFPDKRVLILTTNEEPEKVVPIFRHALNVQQFSSELSILEGSYQYLNSNELLIVAKKNFTNDRNQTHQTYNQRRQAKFHWSRQTPLSQRFNLRFELKTVEGRLFRNNVLKWLEYTISTKLETGQEVTLFDLSSDTFPNLTFSRVKKFNLRLTEPLSSH